MAIITLRIFKENNKTHTRIAVGSSDTIVFKNDSDEILRITIDKEDALKLRGKPIDMIKLDGEDEESFTLNEHYPLDSTFKYTATIGSSEAEDPVIIIDHR